MRDLAQLPETGTGRLRMDLVRRLTAEGLGTGLLVVAVVGSGIMASRLSPSDVGLELLENAAATAVALIGLILVFGAVSGAHLNPVVTLVDRTFGTIETGEAALYIAAQAIGACLGTMLANAMFQLPLVDWSTTTRSSGALWLSEVVATVTLLLVIHGCVRTGRANVVPFAVGLWVGGAYFFTSSTSFANPAVTIARTLSDSFAGIAPASAPMFIAMQLIGAVIAFGLVHLFFPTTVAEDLAGTFGPETVERFIVDSLDRLMTSAKVIAFPPPLTETLAEERLRALARVEGHDASGRPSVLFLCVHNAGRSQMAAGWLRHLAGDRVVVYTGGTEPAAEINPVAIAAMAEVGVDVRSQFPKPWTEEVVRAADIVVTMGCGDACPVYPGTRYEDWEVDDPAGQDLAAVRAIRDEIRARVERLMASLGVAPA